MKLDSAIIRALSKQDFRVLTAVEMGMKNHEFVPTSLISSIAGVKRSGTSASLGHLHKFKLLMHENKQYDGYRLNSGGYDILAIKTFVNKDLIHYIDKQIGVGKEADVYLAYNEDQVPLAIKLHKLGRTSFRTAKTKREYHGTRTGTSWLYLSRLAAAREFKYLQILYGYGFPVPKPYNVNRNCILMGYAFGTLLNNISEMGNPRRLYMHLMDTLDELLRYGLVHGDFNEFNIILDDDEQFTLIDMPQMVRTSQEDARSYFERDVNSIRDYFAKKFDFRSSYYPEFYDISENDDVGDARGEGEAQTEGSSSESDNDDEVIQELTLQALSEDEESEDGEDGEDEEEEDSREDVPRYPFEKLLESRRIEVLEKEKAEHLRKEMKLEQRRVNLPLENGEEYGSGEESEEDGEPIKSRIKKELTREKHRSSRKYLKGKGKGRDRKKGKDNVKNKKLDFV